MKFENFDDLTRSVFASKIESSAKDTSAIQSVLAAENADGEVPSSKESKMLQEYLDVPFGDAKELAIKKMFTTAVVIAKEKGVLPFKVDADPQQIALFIDDGLSRMKVAYQNGTGSLDAVEAADKLVDMATTRVIAIADRVIECGVPIALDTLSKIMARNPYTAAVAPFIKMATPLITVQAQKSVRVGMALLANTAKAAVKKVMPAIASVTSKISKILFA